MEQGKVVIGTELNTTDFDKDISKIEKRLEELDKKSKEPIEMNGVKVTGLTNLTDEEINEYNDLQQKMQELYNQKMELNKVEKAITQELNNQEAIIDKQKSSTQEQVSNNSLNESKILKISGELEDMVREYNAIQKSDIISSKDLSRAKELKKDIKKTAKEIEKLGGGKISIRGITNIPKQFDGINTGLTKTIKKVAKWGLAIFGVRSAYMAVRSAMGTISQYDDKLASDVEYIKYALAYTLKPVIEWILNAVVKLLQYVNYIAKAWTGKNLFKTADAFKNAQKNAKWLNKELQKTTASFDEMNVLQDTKSGGSADISTPNIDLTGMQGEVPQWLKWIAENKDLILSVFAGITVGLLAWKLGLTGIQSLGIGLAITGIIYGIQSIIEYLQDPSFENFGKIITGIGVAVAGVAIIFGAWPVAVGGAIAAIVGLIISNWEKVKGFILNICKWLENNFGLVGKIISGFIKTGLNLFEGLFKGVKQILDGIIKIFKGNFKSGISLAMKGIGNIIISVLNTVIKGFNAFIWPIRGLIVAAGKITGKSWTMDNIKIPTIPKLAKGGIINQPGRGVPIGYGQAIGGENRAEGVIPLTDSQQMQLLGEAIGRYVRIDNVIDVNMDSRRINRILQSSSDRVNFASNKKVA